MGSQDTDSGQIKTAQTMFRIIETIQEMDGGTVTEVSNRMDMAKSTIYNHLVTLENKGYLVREKGTYSIGLRFLDHGEYAKSKLRVSRLANNRMDELAKKIGENIWLVVEEAGRGVTIDLSVGGHGVQTSGRVGNITPLHIFATGKAILSELPRSRVEEITETRGLQEYTSHSITNEEDLFEELEATRKRGYGVNKNEFVQGQGGLGVAIRTGDMVHGALGIAFPINRLEKYKEDLPQELMGATNEIELALEYDRD